MGAKKRGINVKNILDSFTTEGKSKRLKTENKEEIDPNEAKVPEDEEEPGDAQVSETKEESRDDKLSDSEGESEKSKNEKASDSGGESDENDENLKKTNFNMKEKTEIFEAARNSASDDDLIWEYSCFVKQLPPTLPLSIRNSWLKKVSKLLEIRKVRRRLRNSSRPMTFHSSSLSQTPVLDAMSTMLGQGWRIMAPPTLTCLMCKGELTRHNKPIQVKLHSRGTLVATKYVLRCKKCKEARRLSDMMFGPSEHIQYHPTRSSSSSFSSSPA